MISLFTFGFGGFIFWAIYGAYANEQLEKSLIEKGYKFKKKISC
jgi:hypothetical protein